MSRLCIVAFLALPLTLAGGATDPTNMTGTWRLNVEKSEWGSRPKPVSVTLHIEHREPALSYHGTVVYAGEEARQFVFAGALDGKEYRMERSFGRGTAVLHRIDEATFESVFRTDDGKSVETTRTSIARDGTTLTRRIRLESNGVKSKSKEVYELR
jgi:hypothetical protein